MNSRNSQQTETERSRRMSFSATPRIKRKLERSKSIGCLEDGLDNTTQQLKTDNHARIPKRLSIESGTSTTCSGSDEEEAQSVTRFSGKSNQKQLLKSKRRKRRNNLFSTSSCEAQKGVLLRKPWLIFFDAGIQRYYFFNAQTSTSVWRLPTALESTDFLLYETAEKQMFQVCRCAVLWLLTNREFVFV